MTSGAPTNPITASSAQAGRRLWLLLLGVGGGLLLAGITLIIVFAAACDRVVYANEWDVFDIVAEQPANTSWPGRQMERRISLFHARSCRHRVASDGPMRLEDALHAGYLPCTDCLGPGFGRAAEPQWAVAGFTLTVAGLGGIIAALAALAVTKYRQRRCPRCGGRRTLNFCSTCGGKLTTAAVQPMRR
jgi:hypothetical protein